MKANELMIGDWLRHYNGTPMQVTKITTEHFACAENGGVNCWEYNNKFEPIPLTPEILEKNGFNDTSFEANLKYKYVIHTIEYQLGYYTKTNSFNIYKRGIDPFYTKDVFCCGFQNIVKYVHELQHALKLCGIDKEIVV